MYQQLILDKPRLSVFNVYTLNTEADMTYDVIFEVQVNKQLTESQRDRLREAMLKALDEAAADLPFNADVVTASVLVR
jgi:hypothetical protein